MVCGGEAVARFESLPGGVDLACEGIADEGISFVGRSLWEHPESFVEGGGSDFCGGEEVEEFFDDAVVGFVVFGIFFRLVEVAFEAGFKNAVVVDIPSLAVPSDDFCAWVERRDVAA